MGGRSKLLARLWPRVPAAIADDLAILRIARLRALVPVLYATLIAVVSTAMLAASVTDAFSIRFGLPLVIIGAAAIRLSWWLRHRRQSFDADAARRQIRRTILIAVGIAGLCSLWTTASWMLSVPGQRAYYPMFLGMGVLTTAFCLASVRCATAGILVIGNLPIAAVLAVAGNRMDHIAAAIILLATAFLARLILDQHDQQVEMLLLRRRLHRQAMTDPLTELANRRALHMAAEEVFADGGAGAGLILIDLDRFKPVNDNYGHAVGDMLLIAIGERLGAQAGGGATVARIGGDEFAILIAECDAATLRARASAMLAALAAPFAVDGHIIHIGASAGFACAPADGASLADLLRTADAALYAAKPQDQSAPPVAGPRRSLRSA